VLMVADVRSWICTSPSCAVHRTAADIRVRAMAVTAHGARLRVTADRIRATVAAGTPALPAAADILMEAEVDTRAVVVAATPVVEDTVAVGIANRDDG
jgi:hypothetical protein